MPRVKGLCQDKMLQSHFSQSTLEKCKRRTEINDIVCRFYLFILNQKILNPHLLMVFHTNKIKY